MLQCVLFAQRESASVLTKANNPMIAVAAERSQHAMERGRGFRAGLLSRYY